MSTKNLLHFLLITFLFSCTKDINQHPRKYDRYVLGFSYANNCKNKQDSSQITSTICRYIIYLTKDDYCQMLKYKDDKIAFYEGFAKKENADSIITILERINDHYPKKYNPGHACAPDINIMLENDTASIYKFLGYIDLGHTDLLDHFELRNNLKMTDTLENMLKYNYFITNRVSYFTKDYYGFCPANTRLLRDERIKEVFPDDNIPSK